MGYKNMTKQEYDRKYWLKNKVNLTKDRCKYMKEYFSKNKEKINKRNSINYHLKYKNDPKQIKRKNKYAKIWKINNKQKINRYMKSYKLIFPIKYLARSISQGIKIPKNQLCQECNKNLAKHKHHVDYRDPFAIIFVCYKCHPLLDKRTICAT